MVVTNDARDPTALRVGPFVDAMLALGIGALTAPTARHPLELLVDRGSEWLVCIGAMDLIVMFTTRQRVGNAALAARAAALGVDAITTDRPAALHHELAAMLAA
jgi:hypothetical protein